MKVWLDDCRDPPDDSWKVFRTAEELLEWLGPNMDKVSLLSLDHDLGENRKDGYEVLLPLETIAYFGRPVTFEIRVHSDNPVGRKMMLQVVENIKKARCH